MPGFREPLCGYKGEPLEMTMQEHRPLIFPHDVALRHDLALDTPLHDVVSIGFPSPKGHGENFVAGVTWTNVLG
jgi:hypothetical protein